MNATRPRELTRIFRTASSLGMALVILSSSAVEHRPKKELGCLAEDLSLTFQSAANTANARAKALSILTDMEVHVSEQINLRGSAYRTSPSSGIPRSIPLEPKKNEREKSETTESNVSRPSPEQQFELTMRTHRPTKILPSIDAHSYSAEQLARIQIIIKNIKELVEKNESIDSINGPMKELVENLNPCS